MNEIAPGIFHWTATHPDIRRSVSCHMIAEAGAVIDPLEPEQGWDALPAAPSVVVLTSGLHARDAGPCAQRFGIPIRASRPAAQRIGDALEIEPFEAGDQPAPGITAIRIGALCDDEGALHIAHGEGALAIADGIHHYGPELAFFSDDLLGDDPEGVRRGLRDAYAGLLGLDFAHLLFAHGEPQLGTGKAALREFVARAE